MVLTIFLYFIFITFCFLIKAFNKTLTKLSHSFTIFNCLPPIKVYEPVRKDIIVRYCQLDCSPSLPAEPQLRLEAAKSTTGKLIVVHVHVPHTIISFGNEAISLLAQFWPNFKGRFLGPSLVNSNCHGDICPGNICRQNICPYQQYLSCYCTDFDQTSKQAFWDHL